MAVGPGKYDMICTLAREEAEAEVCMLVVINGNLGSGFSVQQVLAPNLDLVLRDLPTILRDMARQIEESISKPS